MEDESVAKKYKREQLSGDCHRASCTEPHGTDGGLVRLHPRPLRPTDLPLPPFTEIHTDDAQCTAKPPPDLPRFAPSRISRAKPLHRFDAANSPPR
ncbi:hypothetical protein MRX96_000228 [Rhipicephalus microplus]